MKAWHHIPLFCLARSIYFNTNDAPVVTTSADNGGRVQVAACRASSPDLNWLVRVSPRAIAARPYLDWVAGHDVLKVANDMVWRVVA